MAPNYQISRLFLYLLLQINGLGRVVLILLPSFLPSSTASLFFVFFSFSSSLSIDGIVCSPSQQEGLSEAAGAGAGPLRLLARGSMQPSTLPLPPRRAASLCSGDKGQARSRMEERCYRFLRSQPLCREETETCGF